MNNKTLIFDFDGTIADTHHFIIEVYNGFCNEYKIKPIDIEKLEKYKDKTAQQLIRQLKIPVLKIPALIARAKAAYHNDIEKLKPFDGLGDVLRQLKGNGHPLGVLSSNAHKNIDTFLTNHDLHIFDFIHSTSNIWGKHIAIKKCAEKTRLDLSNIVYVGDEVRDIEAAKKLDVSVVAVGWGYNSVKALKKRKPDHLVLKPEELLSITSSL